MKLNNSVAFSLPQVAVPDSLQKAMYGRPYVEFGSDNNFPQYMADLSTVSPTHASILEAKTSFLNSKLDLDRELDYKIDLDDIDGEQGTIEDFLTDIFTNLATFEGGYVEVVYNNTRTRIVALKTIPFESVRVGRYDERGNINSVFISQDWSRKYIKRNQPLEIPTFDPNNITTDSQIMIIRGKKPNQPYYPIPTWMSAIQWILLEDDVVEFSRNSILNGFTPSTILNFHDGEPTEDEKDQLESYISGKFTGKGSTKFMMFFDNGKDNSVDINKLDVPNLSDYWESITPIMTSKIFTGHKIYPSLVGVPVSNGLSSNSDELDLQFQMYIKTSIEPLQKLVLTVLRRIFKFNNPELDIELKFINELIDSDKLHTETEINTEESLSNDNVMDVPTKEDQPVEPVKIENNGK